MCSSSHNVSVEALFYGQRTHQLNRCPDVLVMLVVAALLVILSLSRQAGNVLQTRQLLAPDALAFLVAFGVLLSTSALR